MSECEWCDNEADDWGFNGEELCESCRDIQLERIELEEIADMEREQNNEDSKVQG